MMRKFNEWRTKPWFKNLVLLVIIVVLSVSGIPLWINVWFTQRDLDKPSFELIQPYGDAVDLNSIKLITSNGDLVNLSSFEGNPIFINFFQSWCVPCLAEFNSLKVLQMKMPDVQFVMISAENNEAFKKFVSKASVDLPYFNLNSSIPSQFSHKSIPTSFLLDSRGVVVFRHYAAADWSSDNTATKLKSLIK